MIKLIGVVLVVVLAAGGVWWWQTKQSESMPGTAVNGDDQTPESDPTGASLKETGKQIITSIGEAMNLGHQMRCQFTTGEGDQMTSSMVYVAGEQFWTTAAVGGIKTNALFDGENQYVWMEGNKEGMKFSKACLESFRGKPTDASIKDYRNEFDLAQNVQCEPVETTPISMSLPKDVIFTDQCAMMQESLKMMEEMKKKLPAGMEIPTMPQMAQ